MSEMTFTAFMDFFWLSDKPNDWRKAGKINLSISRNFKQSWAGALPPDCLTQSFEIEASEKLGLAGNLERSEVVRRLGQFSQLGIKNFILGKSGSVLHTRLNHSLGTLLVGTLYYEVLLPFIAKTKYRELPVEESSALLKASLLLHDIGHLPYGHLLEEVFNELNWKRISQSTVHRHDEAPIDQLTGPEKEAIKSALEAFLPKGKRCANDWLMLISDLIAGVLGVPFLDAIANSALDADKIDYIFRDMEFTGKRTRLSDARSWLEEFLSGLSLSPEGLVKLNAESAVSTLKLLQERQFLYRDLYLRPDIRAFEKLASTVIKSWLVANLFEELKIPERIQGDLRVDKAQIAYQKLMQEFNLARNELEFIIRLCNSLSENVDAPGLRADKRSHRDVDSRDWFKAIAERFKRFNGCEDENTLAKEYDDIRVGETLFIPRDQSDKAREIVRQLYIDYPCTAVVDVVDFPRFLPTPASRKLSRKPKDDLYLEVFLAPNPDPNKWGTGKIEWTPLHYCNFDVQERKYSTVTVIDPIPEANRGLYVYELFRKRCLENSITIFEEETAVTWRT